MVIKTVIFRILKRLAYSLLKSVYNYIDYNKDGYLSKTEINDFYKKVKKIIRR